MQKAYALLLALVASALVTAQVPPYVPQEDLVGWWPFTGNADDLSGSAHHGTASGAVLASDRFGTADRAYAFNGTSSYIEVADAPALRLNDDSYTIAWWALVNTFNANATAFVVKRGSGPQNGWMVVANGLYDNKIEMKTSSGQDMEIRCDTALAAGAWFHFAIVNDTAVDSILFYANGSEVYRQANGGLYYNPNSTAPLRFGSDTSIPAGTYFLNGAMDDIGIWQRRLTAQEVLDLFLNTNVSVMEHSGSDIRVVFDAAGRELVMQLPPHLIGASYSVIDAGGRGVDAGIVQGEVMRFSTKDWFGVYLVRLDAEAGAVVRVVIP